MKSLLLLLALFLLTLSPAFAQGVAGFVNKGADNQAEVNKITHSGPPPAPKKVDPVGPRPPTYVRTLDIEGGTIFEEYDTSRHGEYDSFGKPVYGSHRYLLGHGKENYPVNNPNSGFTTPTEVSGSLPGGCVLPPLPPPLPVPPPTVTTSP